MSESANDLKTPLSGATPISSSASATVPSPASDTKAARWYAAHVLIAQKFRDELPQATIGVYENVYLVSASSHAEATEKAAGIGRKQESRTDGSDDDETWNGRPTRWEFAGVRKVIECRKPSAQPGDGDELTYSILVVRNEEDLKSLAAGEPAPTVYEE